MKKNIIKILWLVYALVSVFLVIYLVDLVICKDYNIPSNRLFFDDNWNITINEKSYTDVSLDDFHFPPLKKGDEVIMQRTLPDTWNFEEAAFSFHIRHTTLEVYIDDTLVFEYGNDRAANGKTVGSGYKVINFLNEYKGKDLKLKLYVTENRTSSSIDSVWISEWSNAYRYIVTENRFPLFMGSFLIVFGIVVTLIAIFALLISKKYLNVLFLAVFSICIGIWTLCYHNILIIFSIPLYLISLMEYMSLFIAPIPIMAYMFQYVKKLNNKKLMICQIVLFILQCILSVISIILHATSIMHSAGLLLYFQIIFMSYAFFTTYILRRTIKNDYLNKKYYSIGLYIVVGCIMYDLVKFCIERYLGLNIFRLAGMSALGIIIFICILIIDLYYEITQKMMEEHERELLIRRAYIDDLTQINNRCFCSDYMMKLEKEHNNTYTVISFDLNGLKEANDTYGHIRGDVLICAAANVISEAFSSAGIVGRMGGDEFIAILKTNDKSVVENLIVQFIRLIEDKNRVDSYLNLSISYGYATSDECAGEDIEKVYNLADKRMYECKSSMRKGKNKN